MEEVIGLLIVPLAIMLLFTLSLERFVAALQTIGSFIRMLLP